MGLCWGIAHVLKTLCVLYQTDKLTETPLTLRAFEQERQKNYWISDGTCSWCAVASCPNLDNLRYFAMRKNGQETLDQMLHWCSDGGVLGMHDKQNVAFATHNSMASLLERVQILKETSKFSICKLLQCHVARAKSNSAKDMT